MTDERSTETRPACFGLARDLDSNQWIHIADCQRCRVVADYTRLRFVRWVERDLPKTVQKLLSGGNRD